MRRRGRGFTRLEILTAAAILAVIFAVLLPALLHYREVARRKQCHDNLRQISLALCNYENAMDLLPMGWVSSNRMGWELLLHPYVQDIALYNIFNFQYPWLTQSALAPDWDVPVWRCAADPTANRVGPPILTMTVPRTNYIGVSGATPISSRTVIATETHGIFGENVSRRFKDLTDGQSHTFLVGERRSPGGPAWNPGGASIWVGVRDNHTQQGQALVIGDCAATNLPNFRGTRPSAVTGFSSLHSGGVHFGFADGSVHFIGDHIDPATYGHLATIDDGHKVEGF